MNESTNVTVDSMSRVLLIAVPSSLCLLQNAQQSTWHSMGTQWLWIEWMNADKEGKKKKKKEIKTQWTTEPRDIISHGLPMC